MRLYRCFLAVLLVAVIIFGVWYCYDAYNKQETSMDGTLVSAEEAYESDYSVY